VSTRRGIAVFGASLESMAVAATAADRAGFHSVWTSELMLASAHEDRAQARREAAAMIAFYGSVKSYAGLFDACGFAGEAEAIRAAFAAGDLEAMVGAVSEAMVDELAVAGAPAEVAEQLRRFDGVVDEVVLSPPTFRVTPERVAENLATLIEHCAPA